MEAGDGPGRTECKVSQRTQHPHWAARDEEEFSGKPFSLMDRERVFIHSVFNKY